MRLKKRQILRTCKTVSPRLKNSEPAVARQPRNLKNGTLPHLKNGNSDLSVARSLQSLKSRKSPNAQKGKSWTPNSEPSVAWKLQSLKNGSHPASKSIPNLQSSRKYKNGNSQTKKNPILQSHSHYHASNTAIPPTRKTAIPGLKRNFGTCSYTATTQPRKQEFTQHAKRQFPDSS